MDPAAFQAFLTKLTEPIVNTGTAPVPPASAMQSSPPPIAAAKSAAAARPPAAVSVDTSMPPPTALPPASIHLGALMSSAPRGMVARTLVRIRRARRLGASHSAPMRAMVVTRVSSELQAAPPDDDDNAEDEEEEDEDDGDQVDHARAPPMPVHSSSPYRFGIATPSPPSRACAAAAAAAAASDDESADDEYKETASASRPRRLRARPAPKRHHDEMDELDSSGDDEPRSARAAAAVAAAAEGDDNDAQSAADDDGGDGADGQMDVASVSTNPNMSQRKKEYSRVQLNRSGCRSFNEFLRRIEFRTDDLHDLTPDEFLSVLPRWVLESRMGNGTPYVWATIKGYINSLQRVVRTFEPASEWGHLTLKDIPAVRDAINELRSREPQEIKAPATPSAASAGGASTPTVGTGGEMTTRRAHRIANGEILPPRESYNYSPPSSAPNSPRHSGQSGADFEAGSLGPSGGTGVGRGRTSAVQKLSPEQEAYMVDQLDPQHPEGLFRLNFINVAKHFGIYYTEEHRALTIRNMLRGSKIIKVRYEGGIKPRHNVDPTQPTNATPAELATPNAAPPDTPSAAPVAAAPAGDAMDTSASNESNIAAAAAPAMSDVPAASAAVSAPAPSDVTTAVPSTPTADAADVSASDADAVYADDDTPFEVVDQSDTSPTVSWRRVRFVAFVPSPGSKRPVSFMYERPWEGMLCPVRIYESFLSHRPPVLTEQTPGLTAADVELSYVLWLKCKKHFGPYELEWFLLAQIGRNKVSSLISTLASGLGFAAGFCNSSIAHAPKRPIVLSTEELESLREENARHLYGVPTREENAVTQQALMAAAVAEQTNANDGAGVVGGGGVQEQDHSSFQTRPAPSRPQRTKAETVTHSNSASALPPMQFDCSALFQQPSQPQQQQQLQTQPSYSPMAPFMPFMQAPTGLPSFPSSNRSFFPSQLDPSSDHMERNRQALQQIDGANQRQQLQRQQNPDVAPLLSPNHLAAPGIALSQASSSLLSPFSFPPLMPHGSTAPQLPVAAPSMVLAPASVESVPSLLLFIDKFQTQLSTLSSYAAECQKSVDALRGMSAQLKVEASAALKVQQQAAKIAEQFQQIEEQKFLIEQLRAEKNGAMKPNDGAAAAQPSGAADAPSSVPVARAADPPSLPVDQGANDAAVTASTVAAATFPLAPLVDNKQTELQSNSADAGGDERKEDAQSSAMQIDGDDDDDELPPLVTADAPIELPSSTAAAVTPATDDAPIAVDAAVAASPSSLTPTKHAASTRFNDQDTTLLQ